MEYSVLECGSRRMPQSSGFFRHILLACWDNILGPQIKYVWSTIDPSDAAQLSTLKFIPHLMLSSEACSESRLNSVDSRLFKIDDGNQIAYGHLFTGRANYDLVSYCLTAIIPGEEMHRLLDWRAALEVKMRSIVRKMQAWLHKGRTPDGFSQFHSEIDSICDMVVYLHRCSLPRTVKIEETLLSGGRQQADTEEKRGSSADSGGSGQSKSTAAAASTPAVTADLLKLAIYAHLCSFGRSVVLGHSAEAVDRMVKTLSLFCSPAERRRCCIVGVPSCFEDSVDTIAESQLWRFVPELSVQGLLLPESAASEEQDSAVEQLANEILQARLPYAIIRLDAGGSVHLSSSYDVHVILSHRAERKALHDVLGDSSHCSVERSENIRALRTWMLPIQTVKEESRFSSFFKELLKLPTGTKSTLVHESLVLQYGYFLERQASAVISSFKQQAHSKVDQIPDVVGSLFPMEHTDDVWLILSVAERLQPGCYDAAVPRSDASLMQMDALMLQRDVMETVYSSI